MDYNKKQEQEMPGFNPKKAPAWTPCPNPSSHVGLRMSLPLTYHSTGGLYETKG